MSGTGEAKETGCSTELELKADVDIWPCLGASEEGKTPSVVFQVG